MKIENFKALADDDILLRRAKTMQELMLTQFQLRTGQLEDSAKIRKLKKELARIATELRAREIAGGLTQGALSSKVVHGISASADEPVAEATSSKRSRFGLGSIRDALFGRRSG